MDTNGENLNDDIGVVLSVVADYRSTNTKWVLEIQ